MRLIGVALDRVLLDARADRGAVTPARRRRIGTVNLLNGRVVGIGPEGFFHGRAIGAVAVRGDLDALAGDPVAEIVSDDQRAFARAVGLGCSARCVPRCGLLLVFAWVEPDAFWPRDGGTLELSGPLGGAPSLASSSATLAVSLAISKTCFSTRANSVAIKASLSAKSVGGVIQRLTHVRRTNATEKSEPDHHTQPKRGVSNYESGAGLLDCVAVRETVEWH